MTKRNWIILGVIALALLLSFELYIRYDHPSFFEEIINEYKNDEKLMISIGGFKSFEYEFNKNELKEDTLNFSITLIGKEKKLVCTGKAFKDNRKEWSIIKKNIIVEDDF